MATTRRRWTREELLLALRLYWHTPFGQQHKRHPPIIALAERLGRTPGSVAMKLNNFTSLDPAERTRGVVGLRGASRQDRTIFDEFLSHPLETVDAMEALTEAVGEDSEPEPPEPRPHRPTTRITAVTARRHQHFFAESFSAVTTNDAALRTIPFPHFSAQAISFLGRSQNASGSIPAMACA